MRDAAGRLAVAAPSAAGDAATKGYVDGKVWDGSDITTGTVAAARLPVATASVPGTMSAADKAKLDAATSAATASTLVMRASNGRIDTGEPVSSGNAATKNYVDTAASNASNLTTGTVAPARLPLATPTTAGALRGSDQALLDTATASATGLALAMRYADGRLGVTSPTGSGDAATKGYVDAAIAALRAELT
jgi:hypothetical protein